MPIKYKPMPMRKDEYEALKITVEYNWPQEVKHWNMIGQPTEGHIYNSLDVLRGYLKKCEVLVEERGTDGAIKPV